MARSTILPLAAALLVGGAAFGGAAAQTTTTTTTTRTLGGITSQTTVTSETSVTGAPSATGTVTSGTATSGTGTSGMATGTAAPLQTGAEAAQQMSSNDKILTKDGIRYVCTGVAEDSRDDPRWKDFAAKLVFTVKGGGYLPDVMTRIENGKGKQVFSMKCDAPWLLVDLPADHYKVIATAEDTQGNSFKHTADLAVGSKGQHEAIIRFNEISG